jgi:hypothetical protein
MKKPKAGEFADTSVSLQQAPKFLDKMTRKGFLASFRFREVIIAPLGYDSTRDYEDHFLNSLSSPPQFLNVAVLTQIFPRINVAVLRQSLHFFHIDTIV